MEGEKASPEKRIRCFGYLAFNLLKLASKLTTPNLPFLLDWIS